MAIFRSDRRLAIRFGMHPSRKIPKNPTVEEDPKLADKMAGWSGANDDHTIADNKWVKHIRIQSDLLTKFWGRPTHLGAVVLLPEGVGTV